LFFFTVEISLDKTTNPKKILLVLAQRKFVIYTIISIERQGKKIMVRVLSEIYFEI